MEKGLWNPYPQKGIATILFIIFQCGFGCMDWPFSDIFGSAKNELFDALQKSLTQKDFFLDYHKNEIL